MCGPKKTTINNEVKEKDVMPAIDMTPADVLIGTTTAQQQAMSARGTQQLKIKKPKPVGDGIGYVAEEQKKTNSQVAGLGINI